MAKGTKYNNLTSEAGAADFSATNKQQDILIRPDEEKSLEY